MENYLAVGTDYGFVEKQLKSAGYETRGETVIDSVVALLAVLDGRGLDIPDRKAVAQLFATLVEKDGELGYAGDVRGTWRPFYLGSFPYGSVVRVRTDAYDTDSGSRHNGLTGTFEAAYAGRAFVQYHGRKDGSGHEHHPSKLEILWKP